MAIKALTNQSPDATDSTTDTEVTIDSQKESFTAATSQYFSLVSSIQVGLQRQIHALEEANILASGGAPIEIDDPDAKPPATDPRSGTLPEEKQKPKKLVYMGGGLGNFDVGWLNSRNDNVGKNMEAELWGKAEELMNERLADGEATGGRGKDSDAEMGEQWEFCPLSRHPL